MAHLRRARGIAGDEITLTGIIEAGVNAAIIVASETTPGRG
jgi:hypothetical protein